MSYSDRLAVIHPMTPTLTIALSGAVYPAIPDEGNPPLRTGLECPIWGGGTYNPVTDPAGDGGQYKYNNLYSNYPTLFASGYSTDNNQTDYIGVKAYSFSAGNPTFAGNGASTLSRPLIQPDNHRIFGPSINYQSSLVIPSLASTLDNPEALIFVSTDSITNIAGLKVKANGNKTLVGLFNLPNTDHCSLVYAAVGSGGSYHILRNTDYYIIPHSGTTYAFTICGESTYPAVTNTSYHPGFTDAALPVNLEDLLNFSTPVNGVTTLIPVAVVSTDLGFLITYKENTGSWHQKYILVDPTWTTFQWVVFTGSNANALAIIAQGAASPFTGGGAIDLTTFVSPFYKDGKWYLLGGTRNAPSVAISSPDNYGIVSIGSTTNDDIGFFFYSPFGLNTSVNALIDGAFFGDVDLSFPPGTPLPDDCTDLVIAAQPFSGIFKMTVPLTGDGPDATECLVYDRSVPIPPFQWSLDFPKNVVNGLWHLEGEHVSILGDGKVYPRQVVTNGKITVPADVTRCHIGLEFDICVVTLPLTTQNAVVEGRRKKVNGLAVRVDKTSGMKIGRNMQELYAMKSSVKPYTLAPAEMLTGMTHTLISTNWDDNGQVHFVQRDPLPITLLSIVTEVEVGDDPE